MAVLRESPWYQEIEERGVQLGVQQGARRQLIRVLLGRFGEIPTEVVSRLESESVEQLESLMDHAIAVSSLEEFLKILQA